MTVTLTGRMSSESRQPDSERRPRSQAARGRLSRTPTLDSPASPSHCQTPHVIRVIRAGGKPEARDSESERDSKCSLPVSSSVPGSGARGAGPEFKLPQAAAGVSRSVGAGLFSGHGYQCATSYERALVAPSWCGQNCLFAIRG